MTIIHTDTALLYVCDNRFDLNTSATITIKNNLAFQKLTLDKPLPLITDGSTRKIKISDSVI